MNQLKILFWTLAVLFLMVLGYRVVLFEEFKVSPDFDHSKKNAQLLLKEMKQKISKEVSIEMKPFIAPIPEKEYSSLEKRDLFSRYPADQHFNRESQISGSPDRSGTGGEQEKVSSFFYKGKRSALSPQLVSDFE